jgi:hypothetical protein
MIGYGYDASGSSSDEKAQTRMYHQHCLTVPHSVISLTIEREQSQDHWRFTTTLEKQH